MSELRTQRRIAERNKDELAVIANKFFNECLNRNEDDIKSIFKVHEHAWVKFANMKNKDAKNKKYKVRNYTDAFYNAISVHGYNRARLTKIHPETKKEFIRIIKVVEHKTFWKTFWRSVKEFLSWFDIRNKTK